MAAGRGGVGSRGRAAIGMGLHAVIDDARPFDLLAGSDADAAEDDGDELAGDQRGVHREQGESRHPHDLDAECSITATEWTTIMPLIVSLRTGWPPLSIPAGSSSTAARPVITRATAASAAHTSRLGRRRNLR